MTVGGVALRSNGEGESEKKPCYLFICLFVCLLCFVVVGIAVVMMIEGCRCISFVIDHGHGLSFGDGCMNGLPLRNRDDIEMTHDPEMEGLGCISLHTIDRSHACSWTEPTQRLRTNDANNLRTFTFQRSVQTRGDWIDGLAFCSDPSRKSVGELNS